MRHKSNNKTRPLFTLSLEMTRLVNETRLLLVPCFNSDIYGTLLFDNLSTWYIIYRLHCYNTAIERCIRQAFGLYQSSKSAKCSFAMMPMDGRRCRLSGYQCGHFYQKQQRLAEMCMQSHTSLLKKVQMQRNRTALYRFMLIKLLCVKLELLSIFDGQQFTHDTPSLFHSITYYNVLFSKLINYR